MGKLISSTATLRKPKRLSVYGPESLVGPRVRNFVELFSSLENCMDGSEMRHKHANTRNKNLLFFTTTIFSGDFLRIS